MGLGVAIALGGVKVLLVLIIRLCLKLSCVLAIKELKWGGFSDKKEADEEESGIADDKFAAVVVVAAAALLQLVVVFEWKIEETPITVEVEAIFIFFFFISCSTPQDKAASIWKNREKERLGYF
jgi:hypothetical protein